MKTLLAYDESLQLIRLLRPIALRLRSRHTDLYRQLRRAASSVTLNLAEGAGRQGADRQQRWRIARGSALEFEAILRTAEAWGDLESRSVEGVHAVLDRVLRLTRGLTR